MKPDKIIILRHGQSEGNVDKMVYTTTQDFKLRLSERGRQQAHEAGETLKALLYPSSIQFYVSPYWRTRDTFRIVSSHLETRTPHIVYEDPRLREQEWSGDFRKVATLEEYQAIEDRRDDYGHFYFRLDGGESCADVFDRVSDFMGTMHRDFEKRNFPRNVIIVTHGMTSRLILMRWFHMTVETFEQLANPRNCEFYVLQRNVEDDKYSLITTPRVHLPRNDHQYPFDEPIT
jgi:broad specificity phosphatase PhoE